MSARKKRKVQLQVKWADGWHTIDKAKTKKKGKFKITGSLDWYGAHKMRVVAPRTRRDRAKVFKTKKFKIAVPWTPRGSASSYLRMSYKGINFQWNPCKTIKYRVNPGYAGEGGDRASPSRPSSCWSGRRASRRSTSAPPPRSRSRASATRRAPTW